MKAHWQYLKYVLRHKWFVFKWCVALGVPRAGITHDLSKFHPREWFPYVDKFYGGPWPESAHLWQSKPNTQGWVDRRFDEAWNHHQKRNPHHWQYWVLHEDSGKTLCLDMPLRYRLEMLADWNGAGEAINGKVDTRNWYLKNRTNMLLHPDTRRWIERMLGIQDIAFEGRGMTLLKDEPLYPPEWGEARWN